MDHFGRDDLTQVDVVRHLRKDGTFRPQQRPTVRHLIDPNAVFRSLLSSELLKNYKTTKLTQTKTVINKLKFGVTPVMFFSFKNQTQIKTRDTLC